MRGVKVGRQGTSSFKQVRKDERNLPTWNQHERFIVFKGSRALANPIPAFGVTSQSEEGLGMPHLLPRSRAESADISKM